MIGGRLWPATLAVVPATLVGGCGPADDARKSRAFTTITDYGVAHRGRVRGQLVP